MSTVSNSHRMPQSKRARLEAKKRRDARRRFTYIGAGVGLVALFGVAIVLSQPDPSATTEGLEQTRAVSVAGAALPPLSDNDEAIGSPIPELTGASFAGDPISIERDGRPKLIVFLAHWCPHCQAEVPLIQSWLDQHGMPHGVDLVSVATATDSVQPNFPPSEWLDRERWSVPVLVDDESSSAGAAFGVNGYPFFVAVDAHGNVTERAAGELSIERLESILGDLGGSM